MERGGEGRRWPAVQGALGGGLWAGGQEACGRREGCSA